MPSKCPNKERCGSCSWSDLSYEEQLQKKLAQINDALKSSVGESLCKSILPSPKTAHYRNRMDFVINYQGLVGLREKGKWWKVIDNHTCFLADERIESAFSVVRAWVKSGDLSFYDRKSDEGLLRYAVIRATTIGEVMINIVTSSPDAPKKCVLALEKLAEKSGCTSLLWSINSTKSDVSYGSEIRNIFGPGFITEEINGIKYKITPNAFFQTNSHGAKLLQDQVLDFIGKVGEKRILDLYSGSGFFTLPLAKRGGVLTGVEVVEEAIRDARNNALENSINAEFIASKSEDIVVADYNAEIIVLDPARAGVHPSLLEQLKNSAASKIIYVSCNYKKFAEEMEILKQKYEISECVAIDMFPHTPHVELVSCLVIKK